MRWRTDDTNLRVGVTLDTEHPAVDLTVDRLGGQLLDALVSGLLEAHTRAESPEGRRWPELARSTLRKKRHGVIGIDSGKSRLLDPATWLSMPRDIRRREAWYYVPRNHQLWPMMHGWQNGVDRNNMPPRRLLGWTDRAKETAGELLRAADFDARS